MSSTRLRSSALRSIASASPPEVCGAFSFAAFAFLLPVVAGARTVEPATSPPQACLSPAEMAALLPASREQAENWCEASDARALERVRAVLRLLGTGLPTPDATTDTAE